MNPVNEQATEPSLLIDAKSTKISYVGFILFFVSISVSFDFGIHEKFWFCDMLTAKEQTSLRFLAV